MASQVQAPGCCVQDAPEWGGKLADGKGKRKASGWSQQHHAEEGEMQEGFTQMAPHPLFSLLPGASYEAGGKVGEWRRRVKGMWAKEFKITTMRKSEFLKGLWILCYWSFKIGLL